MSPKRWILLLVFYISYLMFGASIYYHIEHGLERERRDEALNERIEINSYLLDQLAGKNVSTQEEVLQKITEYCGKPVTDHTNDEFVPPYTWTFYHSFFFAFTVCSTVGYGNISPTSTLGRMIMIAYSVIGIPINGILFAGLGEYFGRTFQSIYRRYKKYKMSNDVRYIPPRLSLITTVTIALIPGVTLFIFLPSWVFSYFEDWPYSLAVYYSYVTTTTIGFGDYVPTFQPHQPTKFGGWFVVYQIFVIVWFIFSLAYLLMIMTFITRGLQSKKLEYLEQQLSSNIKSTQNRIWNGVTKDVGYLRRILNELYIMKFKPVYTEPDFSQMLHRSNSCPELTMYRVDPPIISRKRAFSECYDIQEARDYEATLQLRTASDTDIAKFDRTKSFECAEAFRQTTGLLAKVVSALASVKPPEDNASIDSDDMFGGYHGFSDSQILASEWSFPSINTPMAPPARRGRACSECNIHSQWNVAPAVHNEWTWSGDNNQIQQAINNRVKHTNGVSTGPVMYGANYARPPIDYVVHMDDKNEEEQKQRTKKFSIPDGLRKLFPFKKRHSQSELAVTSNDASAPPERKFSVMSVPETAQNRTPPMDYYSTVTANASPTYFKNGQMWRPPLPTIQQSTPSTGNSEPTFTRMQELFPSNGSLSSRLSAAANGSNATRRNSVYDAQQTLQSNSSSIYQRNIPTSTKKRRASVFTQNPAIAARRGSIFPPTNTGAAAAMSQRRSSFFNTDRRGSGASVAADAALPPRRGSMFPMAATERRPSLFSVASAEDRDVLEHTTLADLIRALEQMHTQAVLDETAAAAPSTSSSGRGGYFKSDKNKRKMSVAGLDPPDVPPILSLFAGTNNKALTTAAANRLYARRATIVGTSPNALFTGTTPQQQSSTASNILTRRRLSSLHNNEPPPSYSEQEVTTTAVPKFKRRFSIRPTALQIPPGQAPPPGVNINTLLQQPLTGGSSAQAAAAANMSQTAMQRRISLRPSPLAREGDVTNDVTSVPASSSARVIAPTSTTRLLPPSGSRQPPTMTSSTHSPLSRIVQISQAQRKSSMPDGFALERNKKSDGGK